MTPLASFEPLAHSSPRERFCILHSAQGRRRGAVVHVHAFADELNKTRRMVAQQALQLARAGWDVLLLDLLGCGDSPGDFEDATWERWLADVAGAAAWLRGRDEASRDLPLWLWGTRLGALLAAAASPSCQPQGLLLWQPVLDGAQHLQQFLRVADAQIGNRAQPRANSVELLQQLADGQAVEVSGYRVGAGLAKAMQAARLDTALLSAAQVVWVDLENPSGHRATRTAAEAASGAPPIVALTAPGAAFWLQVDAPDSPAWWELTTRALGGGAPP